MIIAVELKFFADSDIFFDSSFTDGKDPFNENQYTRENIPAYQVKQNLQKHQTKRNKLPDEIRSFSTLFLKNFLFKNRMKNWTIFEKS